MESKTLAQLEFEKKRQKRVEEERQRTAATQPTPTSEGITAGDILMGALIYNVLTDTPTHVPDTSPSMDIDSSSFSSDSSSFGSSGDW